MNKKTTIIIIIAVALAGGIGWYIAMRPNLPPTTMQGHIEVSPKTHIATEPIPEAIQRHMLEHADGTGEPGIIIQYNCEKFTCESDFVQKLTALAEQYPQNVYLAPGDYDGKLILTKNGAMRILETFDEQAIKTFIQ